ncbi:hypothetical protein HDU91_005680 [Kappamyces sp. JEL0680]|nr:hypothetical protein HDU91_005680 [Kappamyces sp. JEL0680]
MTKKQNALARSPSLEEDEIQAEVDSLVAHSGDQAQERQSFLFLLLRFPLLLLSAVFIFLNLCCYSLARQYIVFKESFWNYFSRATTLKRRLSRATDYDEYSRVAAMLDRELGLNPWKAAQHDEQSIFDESLILKMVRRLQKARRGGKIGKLVAVLQSCCKNDIGGIENKKLYNRTFSGTKNSIEFFCLELIKCLNTVKDSDALGGEEKERLFQQLSTTYGKTALCLSGGALLGWYHLGVAKALFENNILPKIFTGSSAGALIACSICCRTDKELVEFWNDPTLPERLTFMKHTWTEWLGHYLQKGTFMTCQDLVQSAQELTKGNLTFLEAYQISGRTLNIAVTCHELGKTILLNHITAPHVTLCSAAVASSALPLLVPPATLFAKLPDGQIVPFLDQGSAGWRDGSLSSDIPERELHQFFNVKYTIVSQVNPHISLFMFSPRGEIGSPSRKGWRGGFLVSSIVQFCLLDIRKWLKFVRDMELLPKIFGTDFSRLYLQSFRGSMTVSFPGSIKHYARLMTDPTVESLKEFKLVGQQRTFPLMVALSKRLQVEKTLEACLKHARNEKKPEWRRQLPVHTEHVFVGKSTSSDSLLGLINQFPI